MIGAIIPAAILGTASLLSPQPPPGQTAAPVEVLISEVGRQDDNGSVLVGLRLLNAGAGPQVVSLPDRLEARIDQFGTVRTVWLERTNPVLRDVSVPAGGFANAAYRLSDAATLPGPGAVLSIPAWNTSGTAVAFRAAQNPLRRAALVPTPETAPTGAATIAPPFSDRRPGNAFLSNLSVYEPIYAVYGPNTDTEARIQISFKYQVFGSRQAEGRPRSWRDGLHFAYTQRMFWDLQAHSSPFRNIDFQPELFYLTPSATLATGITLSAQAGVRHESNGRDGDSSRSINTIYLAPMAAIPLGGSYRFSIAPRIAFPVGDLSDNPDIQRYRGNLSLFMELGEDRGLRLSTSSRINLATGKGALTADLSYPLARLLGAGPDFYLFGQSFVGYGENLLDYNRWATRFRVGVALVR